MSEENNYPKKKKPLVLLILDGWGHRAEEKYNAISKARTPHWDHFLKTSPHALLDASGTKVGLPEGQMGNSEVGHMHIGAGRTILQDLTRIDETISTETFDKSPVLLNLIRNTKDSKKTLHVMGLLSPGGVHSHEHHLFALLSLAKKEAFENISLHLFMDGRDTPPKSALESIEKLQKQLKNTSISIASISGRYYAMDRDKRWERIEPVYRLLTEGKADFNALTAKDAILNAYSKNITDEFIPPTKIGNGAFIQDGDSVFFFNFRADRARELSAALSKKTFDGFSRNSTPSIAHFVTMTDYGDGLCLTPVFPPPNLQHTFGEVISKNGLSQLRLAETEKYAHVTFFLNGGLEEPFLNESRILVPSPKVSTYDLQPEMSAYKITEVILDTLDRNEIDVIIANFANADMVGHTGDEEAAIKAVECLDLCMGEIFKAVLSHDGLLAITADHGNAECMFDETTHQPHTAHTTEKVPLVFPGQTFHLLSNTGTLADIAPTLLHWLSIPIPKEMSGKNLMDI